MDRALLFVVTGACSSIVLSVFGCGPAGPTAEQKQVQAQMLALEDEFQAHVAARRTEPFRDVLSRMIELDREHPKVYKAVTNEHLDRRDWKGAEEAVLSVASAGPGKAYGLGGVAVFAAKFDEAESHYRRAVDSYRAIDHYAGHAAALAGLGYVLRESDPDESYERFSRAREMFSRLGDERALASTLSSLAALEIDRGRFDRAVEMRRDVVAMATTDTDRTRRLRQLGAVLDQAGRGEASEATYLEALAIADRTDDLVTQYKIHLEIAHRADGLTEVDHLKQALEVASELGDRRRELKASLHLGRSLIWLERHEEALEPLRVAAEGYRPGSKPRIEAQGRLGLALLRAGQTEEGTRLLQETALEAREKELHEEEVEALKDLALQYVRNGELSRALVEYRRILDSRRAHGLDGESIDLNNLGVTWLRLGDEVRAERDFRDGLRTAVERHKPLAEARLRHNLGILLYNGGRFADAEEEQRRALALWAEHGNPQRAESARVRMAMALWQLGRKEEARSALDRAEAGFRAADDVPELVRLGVFRANLQGQAGEWDEALREADAALALAREREFTGGIWQALASRGRALQSQQRLGEALEAFREAIDVLDVSRSRVETPELRMRTLDRSFDVYTGAIQSQSGIEAASRSGPRTFELVERARARGLLDLFAEADARLGESLPAELRRREREVKDEIGAATVALARLDERSSDAARARLRRAEDSLSALRVEMRSEAPGYVELADSRPISLERLARDVLESNETLLSYWIGEDESLLWQVDRSGARWHKLPGRAQIEPWVERSIEQVGRPALRIGEKEEDLDGFETLAARLLPARLPAGHRILIAPDGPLHHLPFDLLMRDGRFLIEDHEIVVVPSATALETLRRRSRPRARAFLGIGAPESSGEVFPELPATGRTLSRIAEKFDVEDRVVLAGADATKTALFDQPLERFRYIHFATHGWLDDQDPRRFRLLLAEEAGRPGAEFLHLNDVSSISVTAELVVLAACESGRGELLRGEGLVGMTRAFLYAGAAAVVAAQWTVDDRASADFMEELYVGLTSGLDPAAALRRAKLEFIGSDRPARRRPYRWAPFVLVGDVSSDNPNRRVAPATESRRR